MTAMLESTPKKVAVVIPCYNEESGIAEVISKFPPGDVLAKYGLQLKIYVIDNNSSDNTAAIAGNMGATVLNEPNRGKGNALSTGFRNLPRDIDYVVMLDGDDTYSPEEILRVIEPLRSDFCEVVIGSRLCGHIQPQAMTRLNYLGNRMFTTLVRLLYRANITDVLTGYFAWKKSALDALAPHIKSPGFAIEMEMITKMAKLGQRMASVPISYHPRSGNSTLQPFKDGSRVLLMLLKNIVWRPPTVTQVNSAATEVRARKIVFVSDSIYPYMKGGKEKRLHEITKRLAAMGYEVHIYTMKWWKEPRRTKVESGVHLHALCRYHKMYHGDRRTIKEGLLFGLACFKLLRVPFDVLDVDHMPFFPIFSAWIVCTLRRRKLYATWHEALTRREWVQYMGSSGVIGSIVERLSIWLPHHITAASVQTQESLAALHGRAGRVDLVASGIDTALLNQVQPVQDRCDVLYVGRLVKDKHVDKLILAVQLIAIEHPEIRCIIIGQGLEKPRLQQLVAKYGLKNNVTFLEPLPKAGDVYAYMKAAKVFCSPSKREGFGIASLEALGCGTPVITSDSPNNAARHLVRHGQNGSVVALDPSALAEAILYWTSLEQKPDVAGPVAEFDWRVAAKKQAEIYML